MLWLRPSLQGASHRVFKPSGERLLEELAIESIRIGAFLPGDRAEKYFLMDVRAELEQLFGKIGEETLSEGGWDSSR